MRLLKGELSKNRLEKPYFERLIRSIPEEGSAYEYVVQDLLDSDYKTPEYEDWSSDDWLCTECLTKFLKDNLHLWLLDKKIQGEPLIVRPKTVASSHGLDCSAGEDIPADCWYGWNCRTQTHNMEHAKKLNVILLFSVHHAELNMAPRSTFVNRRRANKDSQGDIFGVSVTVYVF